MTVPVVLLHGAGEDARIWSEVLPHIGAPVRAHDFPGRGARRDEAPRRSVGAMVDDLAARLDTPAVVVGHSLGGRVAVEALLRRPRLVAGLITVCSSLRSRIDRRVLAALEEGRFEDFLPLVRMAVTGVNRRVPTAVEESGDRLVQLVRELRPEVVYADHEAVQGSDLRGRVRPVPVPVAVLGGELDALVRPRDVAALGDALGVEAEIVPRASHQLPWEQPGAVVDAVRRVRAQAAPPPPN